MRVGHRIIEINGQSVVAVPHERIVNLLATSVGEVRCPDVQCHRVTIVNSSFISDPHEDHANLHVPPADWPGDPCLHLNARCKEYFYQNANHQQNISNQRIL